MIVYTITLILESVFVVALAVIVIAGGRANSRLERERKAALQDADSAQRELEVAIAGKEALKVENANLAKMLRAEVEALREARQENAALNARNTALQEAMEARPTQPKRAVRKNSTQVQQQEET